MVVDYPKKKKTAIHRDIRFHKSYEYLENLVYHFFRQLWLVLGVKLMEINSNLFSRYSFFPTNCCCKHKALGSKIGASGLVSLKVMVRVQQK